MFCKKFLKQAVVCIKNKNNNSQILNTSVRNIHVSLINCNEKKKELTVRISFDDIKQKNKNSYLDMVKIFINRDHVYRRGHADFISAALKHMETFGVHKDLEVYKALVDVLPKGKMIPANMLQAEFMHYPKQQQCALDLLEQMEDNGVMPDTELEGMLLNVFGSRGFPLRKLWRMMYWMPKFKHLSPWPLPSPVPDDIFELAKLAITRISSIDIKSKVTIYETAHIKDSVDETWIVSAQSPIQKDLVAAHDVKKPIYVEGAHRIWLKDKSVNYYILRSESKPPPDDLIEDADDVSKIRIPFLGFNPPVKKELSVIPSVHEQEDGTIFSVCATGTSSKDSLLSWIRHLEIDGNENLAKIPVVFKLKSGTKEIANVATPPENYDQAKNLDEK